MLQSWSLYKLLGIGGKKGGASTYSYHITTMIPTTQHSSLFTNILRLDQGYKTCSIQFDEPQRCTNWIFMQAYHITRIARAPLLVVAVMEDLINTVEKVGAKYRLECGFVQGEYGYVGGDDSNPKAGLFRLIFDLVIS